MALQTSGAISINDIVGEFGGTAPHSLSEYYGVGGGSSSISLGLTPALFTVSGNNAVWTSRSVDISAYEGCGVRPVFLHTNMSGFRADLQLDQIGFGTSLQSFESASSVGSWQTTTRSTAAYASATFSALTTSTTATGSWARDSGGTSSGSTGLTSAANGSWYVYTEATSYFTSTYKYFLRNASSTTITSSNNTLNFSEARYGSNMGTLTAYLDVTSLPPSGAPASGTISLSDFYGLAGPTDLSGISHIFQTFYPIVGYGNGFTYNSTTYNGGTLSPTAIPGTSENIVGVIAYSNPGFQGVYLYTDGTSNSGWSTVTISSDNGFRTYTANRANLPFTLASSVGGTNSGYGGFWTLATQGSTPGYYAFEAVNGTNSPAQSGNAFTIVFT
jgi:hypothetical protein